MTNNNIYPEKVFGEKPQKIEGKFLYAADNNRKVDSTRGQEKVTLTIDEMPSFAIRVLIVIRVVILMGTLLTSLKLLLLEVINLMKTCHLI